MKQEEGSERSLPERIADSLERFATEDECLLGTAAPGSGVNVVPLSVAWIDSAFVFCTRRATRTASNLRASPLARIVYGSPADIVLVDVEIETCEITDLAPTLVDGYTRHVNWDISEENDDYVALVGTPIKIRAWRRESEMTLMRDGRWLEVAFRTDT